MPDTTMPPSAARCGHVYEAKSGSGWDRTCGDPQFNERQSPHEVGHDHLFVAEQPAQRTAERHAAHFDGARADCPLCEQELDDMQADVEADDRANPTHCFRIGCGWRHDSDVHNDPDYPGYHRFVGQPLSVAPASPGAAPERTCDVVEMPCVGKETLCATHLTALTDELMIPADKSVLRHGTFAAPAATPAGPGANGCPHPYNAMTWDPTEKVASCGVCDATDDRWQLRFENANLVTEQAATIESLTAALKRLSTWNLRQSMPRGRRVAPAPSDGRAWEIVYGDALRDVRRIAAEALAGEGGTG